MKNSSEDWALTLRMLRILWFALAASVVLYFVVAQFVATTAAENETLAFSLAAAGIAAGAASFVVKRLVAAGPLRRNPAAAARSAFLVAFVLAEIPALMGLVSYVAAGWKYAWTMWVVSGVLFALHYPSETAVRATGGAED